MKQFEFGRRNPKREPIKLTTDLLHRLTEALVKLRSTTELASVDLERSQRKQHQIKQLKAELAAMPEDSQSRQALQDLERASAMSSDDLLTQFENERNLRAAARESLKLTEDIAHAVAMSMAENCEPPAVVARFNVGLTVATNYLERSEEVLLPLREYNTAYTRSLAVALQGTLERLATVCKRLRQHL